MRVISFGDLHLDAGNKGRRDTDTGLPIRVLDTLYNLDMIVACAIERDVDLVIFSGDAYHINAPKQVFKSLFQERILKLSKEGIVCVLVVGNHDNSKSYNFRHSLYEFKTLAIPNVYIIDQVTHLKPNDLNLPVQIVGIPWMYDKFVMPEFDLVPGIPTILTAHCSIFGAEYKEDADAIEVVLGKDFVLELEDVTFADWVFLAHIHHPQILSENPLVIYPGSCEQNTWGELSKAKRGFVYTDLNTWELIPYKLRPREDIVIYANTKEEVMRYLPKTVDSETMYRITVNWNTTTTEPIHLEKYFENSFEIQVRERKPRKTKNRSNKIDNIEELDRTELLTLYLDQEGIDFDDKLKELWYDLERSVHS